MAFKDFWISKLGGTAGLVPFDNWLHWTGLRLLLPFYHTISNEPLPHIAPLYPGVSENHFKADLDFMLKHFDPIDLEKLMEVTQQGQRPKQPVLHLSFDDGLRQCRDVIAPILLKKGISATFFLNTAFLDNQGLFYRYKVALILEKWRRAGSRKRGEVLRRFGIGTGSQFITWLHTIGWKERNKLDQIGEALEIDFTDFLESMRPYMDADDIDWLLRQGFTIGSHSVDHPMFNEIDREDRKKQVTDSMDYLAGRFGINRRVFAFPFTDDGVPGDFLEWLHAPEGGNIDLSFGTAGLKQERFKFHWQRMPMEGYGVNAKQIVNGEMSYYLMKKWVGRNKIKR